MPAGDPVFVDTNVLVCVNRPSAGQHTADFRRFGKLTELVGR